MSERGYVRGPYGQIHYRRTAPARGTPPTLRPLVFFHQNPRSSVEYEPLLERMGVDRLCIAFDTPGYGQSDAPPAPPGIPAYASALLEGLRELGLAREGSTVDAFGYHTGTYLAVECALQAPALFRRLVLAGVPHVVGSERERRYAARVSERRPRPESGSHLIDAWHYHVTQRPAGMSLERAEALALDYLGSGDRSWWAYQGVFTYPSEERLAKVTQPALLIVVEDSLAQNTRDAARIMRKARLLEAPELAGISMLDAHADRFAQITREFLAEDSR